jgi:hypothetical protein
LIRAKRVARVNGIVSSIFSYPYRDDDYFTMARSLVKRIGSVRPVMNGWAKILLIHFIPIFLKRNFVPLPHDVDLSVENWLNNTSYTEKEKQKFRELDDKINGLMKRKYLMAKCFMKEEYYESIIKEGRGIFSRSDEVKILIGPIIKQIENHQYMNKNFIKHVPVSERPSYIFDWLHKTGDVGESDYTAFESHFDKEMMELVDFSFYDYMTKNIHDTRKEIVHEFSGVNDLWFKDFKVKLKATRLSGEMTTSSFNGFANFLFLQFVACYCHSYFIKTGKRLQSFEEIDFMITDSELSNLQIPCVVEGDDGLARYWFGLPNDKLYEECGLKMKLKLHNSLSTASFCGIVFDEDTKESLTNPIKHLIKTGWLSSRYVNAKISKRKMLIRAKAFSLVHQFPNCPILRSFGNYILRHTKHMHSAMIHYIQNTKFLDRYEKELFLTYANKNLPEEKEITVGSRMVVESVYNVPIEIQLNIERYFDTCKELKEIPTDLILDIVPLDCIIYSNSYVFRVPEDSINVSSPVEYQTRGWRELPVPFWDPDLNEK